MIVLKQLGPKFAKVEVEGEVIELTPGGHIRAARFHIEYSEDGVEVRRISRGSTFHNEGPTAGTVTQTTGDIAHLDLRQT